MKFEKHALSPFTYVKDHVLLSQATMLYEADAFAKTVLNDQILREIVELIPLEWLQWEDTENTPEEIKDIYYNFLKTRLENSENFLKEAKNARG